MKKEFSRNWKSSKQPRKQRKYIAKAPLNVKQNFLNVNLSKELRKTYNARSVKIRSGDTVKILRGQFKAKTGKVTRVFHKKTKVNIEGMQLTKKDGTKAFYPIHPSNLQITELNLEDKKRKQKLTKEKKTK